MIRTVILNEVKNLFAQPLRPVDFFIAMKTLKTTIAVSCLLIASVAGMAQSGFYPKDTAYLKNGKVELVKVREITDEAPEYKILVNDYTNDQGKIISSISGNLVDKIVLRDGSTFRFDNGKLFRDVVFSSSDYESMQGGLGYKGIVHLNDIETRSVLGDAGYYTRLIPLRRQKTVGIFKIIAGAPLIGIGIFKKESEFEVLDGNKYGILKVYGMPVGVTLAATGMLDIFISGGKLNSFISHYQDYEAPGLGAAYTRIGVGTGLVAGGAALLAVSYSKVSKHWDLPKDKPSKNVLMTVGGALLLSAGASELTYGINQLKGCKMLRDAGLENLSIHLGATQNGYGLSVVF